jgi:polyferredoxin
MPSTKNLALTAPSENLDWKVKFTLLTGFSGLFILLLSFFSYLNATILAVSLGLIFVSTVFYGYFIYKEKPEGISNHHVWLKSISNSGFWAVIIGIVLTGFYVLLYWFPSYLGLGENGKENSGLVGFFDPLSTLLNGGKASQWFVYGTLYTLSIVGLGIKFIFKYRHNKYQIVRTLSVIFFQLGFAFLIPEILQKLNSDQAYFAKDIKNMWPLNYYFFDEWHLKNMTQGGSLGMFMLFFGIALVFIISPVLTYFYGKRWYCSWVCGCGGLAETAGDSFRQLSNKSTKAWKFERILIHFVLFLSIIMTISVLGTYLSNNSAESFISKNTFYMICLGLFLLSGFVIFYLKNNELQKDAKIGIYGSIGLISIVLLYNIFFENFDTFFINTGKLREYYGFAVGSAFSGVIGVGFYPILGNRVWCRFGCPMAAILGIQQKLFSRFRITTNGGQCISCGNCSTYCEQGIDVRSYAQRGENIVRASCVGCGICSAVCPRGVLKLENVSGERLNKTNGILVGNDVDLIKMLQ